MDKNMNMHGSMDLDAFRGVPIPMDKYDVVDTYGDVLMGEYVEEKQETSVGSIVMPTDFMKHTWRIVKILKVGLKAGTGVKVGDLVMIPSDKGIPQIQTRDGVRKTYVFFNEDRIFCKVEPVKAIKEVKKASKKK